LQERERKGRRRGRGGFRAVAAAGRRAGGRRKEGGKGRLTRGAQVLATAKEKEKRGRGGPARGDGRWAAGPFGLKGEPTRFSFFSFFFFKLHFKITFLLKFKSKLFQTFSQKFINFLETTQATKNHASQLMMHKHLLSLSLLNYV
jgi:hypothetical protein